MVMICENNVVEVATRGN